MSAAAPSPAVLTAPRQQRSIDTAHDSALQGLRALMHPGVATKPAAAGTDTLADLMHVARVFVALVDAGGVRSQRTYAKAKAALALLEGAAS